MLALKNITKDYYIGKKNTKNYQVVHALKNVSINFRSHELVSILGQSGCGKTTLLNIIGGLDQYTSGDLLINNVSTKMYKDHNWDNYRNHSIGFIFQSYNLIPHQSVLSNVELALTLSGVSREERKKRAIDALTKVGLEEKIYSNPNQLSGGQMQRVAIARALVNDPEIILADEPTGALDSKTSVQIMDILKEISKEKLIIMVTHNPDLAKEYSTRIIELFDGEVISDSKPYEIINYAKIEDILDPNKKELPNVELVKSIKENMSLNEIIDILGKPQRIIRDNNSEKVEFDISNGKHLSVFVSDENKTSKKIEKKKTRRMTFFTALSLSIKNLLTKKARTTLVSFAGSIGIIGIALVLSMSSGFQNYIDKIQEETLSTYPITINSVTSDMSSLLNMFAEQRNAATEHGLDAVYSNNIYGKLMQSFQNSIQNNDLASFKTFLETDEEAKTTILDGNISYSYNVDLQVFKDENATLDTRLNTSITGMFGNSNDGGAMMSGMEIWSQMIDNKDLINRQYDVLAGKMPENYDEIVVIVDENNEINDFILYGLGLITDEEFANVLNNIDAEQIKISYDTILEQTYIILPKAFYYELDDSNTATQADLKSQLSSNNAIKVKVSGIIKPKSENVGEVLTGVIGYSSDLTRNVIEKNNNSPVAKYQIEHPDINVMTGRRFDDENSNYTSKELLMYFASLISGSSSQLWAQFIYDGLCRSMVEDKTLEQYYMLMGPSTGFATLEEFLAFCSMFSVDERVELFRPIIDKFLIDSYSKELDAFTDRETYQSVSRELGICDIDVPSQINIYASDFKNKEEIINLIDKYNKQVAENGHEEEIINFTDYVGLLMSSVSTIIDIISTVLIVFVSISLVVSSIMIGVITYISVLERIKEIGILRSIGASKQDIKRVFTAESVTIGFLAGVVGILTTLLVLIPGNIILKALTDISHLASLPFAGAIILILVSVFMTFIAGLIPANLASKKDPVVALRTE